MPFPVSCSYWYTQNWRYSLGFCSVGLYLEHLNGVAKYEVVANDFVDFSLCCYSE
jgi:hypothetical protein